MTRNVQAELEHEADRKGLHGERRERYIGGAWQHIKHPRDTRRAWWRSGDDEAALSAVFGEIHDVHTPRSRRDKVVFRQGDQHYEMPESEYRQLVKAGRAELKQRQREEAAEKKRRAFEEKEARRITRLEELDRIRDERRAHAAERAAEREARRQERISRQIEEAEYRDVLSILRRAGGVKRYAKDSTGKEAERGEYNLLPEHVRHRRGRIGQDAGGVNMDEAAMVVSQHIPWLRLETGADLVSYFDRRQTRRNVLARAS